MIAPEHIAAVIAFAAVIANVAAFDINPEWSRWRAGVGQAADILTSLAILFVVISLAKLT